MIKVTKVFMVVQFISLLCLINQPLLFAKGAGSSAGTTLLQPISARASSIAEACSSLSGDILLLHYNPAGFSSLKEQQVSFMYQRGFADDNFGVLLYGRNLSFAALATSIVYYDTGKIDMIDSGGNTVTKTGQRDVIFTVGLARAISGFPFGVSLKTISSQIFGESATAFAVDLGTQYQGLVKNLSIGLAVQNLGTKLQYLEESESLPLTVRPGASYSINPGKHSVTCSLDLPCYVNEGEILTLLGINYTYNNFLSARLGYRLNLTDTSTEDQPLNLGFGFTWNRFSLSYATGITKNLKIPQRVSLDIRL